MTQSKQQEEPFGRMCSTPMQPSPVQSNTTHHHDRLRNVVRLVSGSQANVQRAHALKHGQPSY